MQIDTEELEKAAKKFSEANQVSEKLVADLDETMKRLAAVWEDAGQQAFFEYFKEWRKYTLGSSEILQTISNNMHAIAKKYSEADEPNLLIDK